MQNSIDVTCSISTKDRYHTTLPICLVSIANQTHKPKKILVFDDGEQKDLRKDSVYASIFALLNEKGIEIEVIFGKRKGQVHNHQMSIGIAKTEWIWRVDDDDAPESNVLELLVRNIRDDVGAVSGLVLDPSIGTFPAESCSGNIEDIFTKPNIQWSRFKGVKEVDHLNNTFLFRKSAAKHGYCLELSPVGHREETMFTYEIKLAGYKLLVDPEAVIWHLRSPSGGIRSYEQSFLWEHDEKIFNRKLEEYKIKPKISKLIVLDCGLGDHYAFKMILPELKNKYSDLVLAVCYPEVFEDDNVKITSIIDAKQIMSEENFDKYNIYRFMIDNNWTGRLVDAYRKMLL